MKKQNTKQTKLYYLYDQEADIFYLSQGKPSARDSVTETSDEVILRSDKTTGHVRGFTILNFSKRQNKNMSLISLPILSNWVSA